MTRAGILGGLAATGAFAGLAAHGFAGTTTQQSATTTPSTAPAAQGGSTSSSSAGQSSSTTPTTQLQAPVTTVQPSKRSGRVTSGGS